MKPLSQKRDLRVDLLRGAALLFILWDHFLQIPHLASPFFLRITPVFWGISSALAIFVYLSGYVYGLVYRKVVSRGGLTSAFLKSYDRAWQLYVINLFTLIVAVGAIGGIALLLGGSPANAPYNLGSIFRLTETSAWHLLTLRFFPGPFAILPLYIGILLIAPFFLLLMRWHLGIALAFSGILYTGAQLGLTIEAPLMICCEGEWPFNPFAWQLLFCIGIAFGWTNPRLHHPSWARAAGILVLAVAIKVWLLGRLARHGVPIPEWLLAPVPWSDKSTLGGLRLLYFLILAYATSYYTQSLSAYLRRDGRPQSLLRIILIKPGQHSLTVYVSGIVITVVAYLLLEHLPPHWELTVLAIAVGWMFSISIAQISILRLSIRRKKPPLPSGSTNPSASISKKGLRFFS